MAQLQFDFEHTDRERTTSRPEASEAQSNAPDDPPALPSADDVCQQVLTLLRDRGERVGISEMRTTLGYPEVDPEKPRSKPVHNALAELRDAGQISSHEPDFGDPSFELSAATTLAPTPAADRLLRPDRQIVYPDAPIHDQWPSAASLHDRDTITVDRISADIDGPSHRFVIKRNDAVQVYFGQNRFEVGVVTGISHANEEVRVGFRKGSKGSWFYKGEIYPVPDPTPVERIPTSVTYVSVESHLVGRQVRLTRKNLPDCGRVGSIVRVEQREPDTFNDGLRYVLQLAPKYRVVCKAGEFEDAGAASVSDLKKRDTKPKVATKPYSLDDHKDFRHRMWAGEMDASTLKETFKRLVQSKDEFISGLVADYKATQLGNLAAQTGCWDARRNTKQKNAAHIYRAFLQDFAISGSVQYSPMSGETFDDAVAKQVRAITDQALWAYVSKKAEETEKQEQALRSPQTLSDFRTFVRVKSERELNDEQLATYDRLEADESRSRRASKVTSTVSKLEVDSDVDLELTLKDGYHDKRKCPLWIVQIAERVERPVFNELNRKAKMLGGWYSSFSKSDAGFQFLSKDSATKFIGLLQTGADRTDELAARRERKESNAATRLSELAGNLDADAQQIFGADETRKKNTARRAELAAGLRGRAYRMQQMAQTVRSIASALTAGQATYLDGVKAGMHIDLLVRLLRQAQGRHNRKVIAEGKDRLELTHREREHDREREPIAADVRYAQYPYPTLLREHLLHAVATMKNHTGCKQAARKMEKRIRGEGEYVRFEHDSGIYQIRDFVARARAAHAMTEWEAHSLEDFDRLRRANIHTTYELRQALRELIPHLAEKGHDDPVTKILDALRGRKIPGFFPTPPAIITRMIELAGIQDGHTVLEPSAGIGSIAEAVRQTADVEIKLVERSSELMEVLTAKGYDAVHADFLDVAFHVDRVLMNPPFENGQECDHVRHAFEMLKPRGQLVAIMSEGPFFREDSKAIAFREWLERVGGRSQQLPDDSFKGVDAFRETGVRTRIVTIARKNQ